MSKQLKNSHWILLFSLCWIVNDATAQVAPPDFSCIRNDTLFWTPTTNSCGSFLAYRIYSAATANGPYSLLADVTDIGQVDFFHANPNDETRFYFMETIADCPGEANLQSDTLDNLAPAQFAITSVSVESGRVVVNWEPSNSPEVNGYIIYRRTNLGIIPIDTVFQTTTYVDQQSIPDQQSEQYFVIALDPCGNTSIFDLPHRTIFLQTSVRSCDPNIYLDWNRYENWPAGLDRQELWVSRNGGAPVLVETLSAMDTTYIFDNTLDGESYQFFIQATANQTGYESVSNIAARRLTIVQPITELVLTHLTVNLDQTLTLEWYWNPEADLQTATITTITATETIATDLDLSGTPTRENNYTLTPGTLDSNTLIGIRTLDSCDRETISSRLSPILLSGEARRDFTNVLQWTSYQVPNGEVLSYQISRVENGRKTFLQTVGSEVSSFVDVLDSQDDSEQLVCYVIEAEVEIVLPDGRTDIKTSQSNLICIRQFFTLLLPNAFAPDGLNNVFKPAVVFGDDIDFEMQIYNRWGERIFVTKDINVGWTGRQNGVALQGGVYIYWIKVRQPDGVEETYKGFVTLVK